ncbi:MAG: deoxyguanosinetriphosphate triphosphohydrolase [Chloroflexota bacterium]
MYANRERLEAIEAQALAPYALLSQNSRGRIHHEPEPQYRTAFQRDRDRIVHSAAFRHLEYRTQVFVNDAGDYYRTRLTHTLEVAQIGRTIARTLGANEDLVETICLAHDLGHPPFGHAGEDVLDRLMADYGGFNHNHQSYRVVTEIERRYERWPGLNLTLETLEGIARHETSYDMSRVAGLPSDVRGSVEAQIADVADELAYNAHDLDDGLKAGLITPSMLTDLTIWQRVVSGSRWNGANFDDLTRHHMIRELVGLLVDDVVRESWRQLKEVDPQSSEDVQHYTHNLVGYSPEVQQMSADLKQFLHQHMYQHYQIVRMSRRAERFIQEIFNSYVAEPRQLPPASQALIPREGVHRVVADYIAGLTDRSALQEHRRLFDPTSRPDAF